MEELKMIRGMWVVVCHT